MKYFLDNMDYEKHNEEVAHVWEAYNARKPIRVPMILSMTSRIYLLNPELNKEGITFQQYSENPDLMAKVQMLNQDYIRHNMIQDVEMGLTPYIYTPTIKDELNISMRDANNLSPCTPVSNIKAMYEAAKKFGTYQQ